MVSNGGRGSGQSVPLEDPRRDLMTTSLDPSMLMDQMKEQAWASNTSRPNSLFSDSETIVQQNAKDMYLQDLSDCKCRVFPIFSPINIYVEHVFLIFFFSQRK